MANFSKSVLSYSDVHQAFQKAGELGSLTLEFDDHKKATVWVGRANAYRVLLRKQAEAKGRPAVSEFDHLMVRRQPKGTVVTIEPRGFDFAKVTGPDGKPVELSRQTIFEEVPAIPVPTLAEDIDNFLNEFEEKKK